ncbi:hypothetical protein X975_05126, partial [Stegodyphus mimosarum]
MKWLILAFCVACAVQVTVSKKCNSAEDCDEGECCVSYVFLSSCQKLRNEGESCTPLVKESDQTPDKYHFQCPCKEDLKCVATYKLRIGEHTIRLRPKCLKPEDEDLDTTLEPFGTPEAE